MYGEFNIDRKHFHLASLIASIEYDNWHHKDGADSKHARFVGVLGEMFTAMYLETVSFGRSVLPQGIFSRTGLFSGNTLDRGDVILVGKRTIKKGNQYKNYQIDAVWTYETKATSTDVFRGMIECSAAEEYAARRVEGVVLVSITLSQHQATGVIEDVAYPQDIVDSWPVVQVDGRMFYQSPMVRRKIENGA